MKQYLRCKLRLRYYIYVVKSRLHVVLCYMGLPLCHGADGPCFHYGKLRRQSTAYCDDELNWIVACPDCFEAIEEQWKDLWSDISR